MSAGGPEPPPAAVMEPVDEIGAEEPTASETVIGPYLLLFVYLGRSFA
jgi:hypothetical protein